MKIEEVKNRLESIANERDDWECAHNDEDRLYREFVLWVASEKNNIKDIRKVALEVLKSQEIQFPRYTA